MNKTNAPKTKQIAFTINLNLLDKVDELLADEGAFLSRGDVIRSAIAEFYDSHRPKYIYEKSVNQKEKRKELLEEKTFEKMTDRDYALSLQSIILTNRKGIDFAAFMSFNNQTIAVRLDGIKKWKGTEQFEVNLEEHLRLVESGESLEDRLKTPWSIKEFDREYDIELN